MKLLKIKEMSHYVFMSSKHIPDNDFLPGYLNTRQEKRYTCMYVHVMYIHAYTCTVPDIIKFTYYHCTQLTTYCVLCD